MLCLFSDENDNDDVLDLLDMEFFGFEDEELENEGANYLTYLLLTNKSW